MERCTGTISAIKYLGYTNRACVRECECDELPCPLLTWLVNQIWATCPDIKEKKSGLVLVGELRDVLASMHCPIAMATKDLLGPELLNKITEFLVSELQAVKILQYKELHTDDNATGTDTGKEQRVVDPNNVLVESDQENDHSEGSDDSSTIRETSAEVMLLLQALNMEVSSEDTDVLREVKSRLCLLPCGGMAESLLKSSLNTSQWRQVERINNVLVEDYRCRRQMMIKRFEVTLQSFAWGEKEEENRKVLASVPSIASLAISSQVSQSLLLASREDQAFILPVRAGPSTAVYKVLMGSVPDRGGRPGELEPPMPCWEGRREKGRGGGGGGRGGGGRNQQRKKFSEKKKRGGKVDT